jgi:hypothetical protein
MSGMNGKPPLYIPNVHQHTSGPEEIACRDLSRQLTQEIGKRVQHAISNYRPGQKFLVDLQGIQEYIEQAYALGRDHSK